MREDRWRGVAVGRRRLLGILGLAGTAPLWLAGAAGADDPPRPGAPAPAPAGEAAGPSEEARALADLARRRYGAHLDEAQMELLTDELDGNGKSAARLRQAKLANADEPDFVFRAEP